MPLIPDVVQCYAAQATLNDHALYMYINVLENERNRCQICIKDLGLDTNLIRSVSVPTAPTVICHGVLELPNSRDANECSEYGQTTVWDLHERNADESFGIFSVHVSSGMHHDGLLKFLKQQCTSACVKDRF